LTNFLLISLLKVLAVSCFLGKEVTVLAFFVCLGESSFVAMLTTTSDGWVFTILMVDAAAMPCSEKQAKRARDKSQRPQSEENSHRILSFNEISVTTIKCYKSCCCCSNGDGGSFIGMHFTHVNVYWPLAWHACGAPMF
jgi:hypothetical protein